MEKIKIETKRLIIIPRTLAELKKEADEEMDPEMKQAYTEMYMNMFSMSAHEEWGSNWKICLKSGEIVGGLCFKGAPDENGEVEIGYGIEAQYQNKGYATEAVGGIVKWALIQDGLKSITAQTDINNVISKRVLEKNGFIRDGDGYEGPLYRISK